MPAYASGPRAAMKPSGTPTTRKSAHASRRARARFGSLRFGPRGSFQSGRGRLREPAIGTPSTRMGIDKDDGESIRNDKRPPPAVGTCGARSKPGRANSIASGPRGEKTKSFAVISSHSNEEIERFSSGSGGWRGLQGLRSLRVGDVAFAVVLALLIAGSLNAVISPAHVGSPSAGTVGSLSGGSLPSWNPNVACAADLVSVPNVLGSAYPNQALIGSRYQTNSTAGGVPNKRQLLAPCTITNVTGQSVASLVEIHGVYLNSYTLDNLDCSHGFARINGGAVYPDGKVYCDSVGDILSLGTTNGKIHIEFDQDWLAKGWCGSQTTWCNNVSAVEYVSLGSISLDVQGFVYWDDTHWEVHPLTAMRLSSGFSVSADPTSLEIPRNYTTRANVKVLGASTDPVALSVSGCPSATVCTLSPASGSPIFASSLRVNTSASPPGGTFNLVVGATNASLSRSVTVPLTIGDRVLATFHRGDGGLFSETDDTNISSGAPNTNFGKNLTLQVDGTCHVTGNVCKTLVKFPLIVGPGDGQIPAYSKIMNATLVLFIKDPGGA